MTPVVLTCQITQTNTDGDNVARVRERVVQNDGADQRATLNAQVTQTNGTGDNESNVKQTIDQRSERSRDGERADTEPGRPVLGADRADERQRQQRLAPDPESRPVGKASGGSNIVQRQFGDHFGDVDQTIGDVSKPSATGNSKSKHKKSRKSKSFSRSFARQTEHQRLKGPGQQIQIGPLACCSTQLGGDPDNTQARIRQSSRARKRHRTDGPAVHLAATGTCTTVGDCGIRHRAQNNEDSIRVLQRCVAPEGGTCSLFVPTTCGSEGCSSGGGGEGSASVKKRRR